MRQFILVQHDTQPRRIGHGDRAIGRHADRLGQDAVAGLWHPARRLVGILDGMVPWPGSVDVQVDQEAQAIGPGVRRVAQPTLAATVEHPPGVTDAAAHRRIGLIDIVTALLQHHLELLPTAVQFTAGDGHFGTAAQLGLLVVGVHIEGLFDPTHAQVRAGTGKVGRPLQCP